MKLALEIITPIKVVLNEEVDEITLPTVNGEISILPNHVDLLTKIIPGEMTIHMGNKIESFVITGGFLEISGNKVSILADHAVRADDIEVAKAQQAKERAEKAMKEKASDKDFVVAEAELRKSILELKVAHKRKAGSH
jgi:F-type H+-transporting ATPase subunit epsilon